MAVSTKQMKPSIQLLVLFQGAIFGCASSGATFVDRYLLELRRGTQEKEPGSVFGAASTHLTAPKKSCLVSCFYYF
jgi:hypothetical protein